MRGQGSVGRLSTSAAASAWREYDLDGECICVRFGDNEGQDDFERRASDAEQTTNGACGRGADQTVLSCGVLRLTLLAPVVVESILEGLHNPERVPWTGSCGRFR